MNAERLQYRFGFVMEQTLGHRTHYRNLRRFASDDSAVAATWLPIEFEPTGTRGRIPLLRGNWSARASWLAHRAVTHARGASPLDLLFYHTQVTSLLAPRQRGIPIVISLDATPINYDTVGRQYGHTAGGPLEPVKAVANRRAFRAASALVAWCRWAKDSLVTDYGVAAEKISVIAPGVDLSAWPQRAPGEHDEGRLPRLLFVGGDFARKGGDILLNCFDHYLRDRCELHLVTQAPIAPRPNVFVYADLTPNSDRLRQLYAEADIFVFPTLADCAPLSVPEAMAASLPVITTPIGAIPEMVTDNEHGLLIKPNDVAGLREAIQRLLASAELRARLGEAGRRRVERDYDAGKNANRLLDLLKQQVRDDTNVSLWHAASSGV